MIQENFKIGILGFGNMGKAIYELLNKHIEFKKNYQFFAYSRGKIDEMGITQLDSLEKLVDVADLIFVCVKPQDFYQIKPVEVYSDKNKIVISIMAGIKVDQIKKIFSNHRIVRTMPNLPLQVGEGVVAWHAHKKQFDINELRLFDNIFSKFGQSFFVEEEKTLDILTVVSGAGPAYVFAFVNSLYEAGLKLGANKDDLLPILFQTINGSVAYLKKEYETNEVGQINLDELINKVASKGGVTEAALSQINLPEFYKKWKDALKAAYKRVEDLAQERSKVDEKEEADELVRLEKVQNEQIQFGDEPKNVQEGKEEKQGGFWSRLKNWRQKA